MFLLIISKGTLPPPVPIRLFSVCTIPSGAIFSLASVGFASNTITFCSSICFYHYYCRVITYRGFVPPVIVQDIAPSPLPLASNIRGWCFVSSIVYLLHYHRDISPPKSHTCRKRCAYSVLAYRCVILIAFKKHRLFFLNLHARGMFVVASCRFNRHTSPPP